MLPNVLIYKSNIANKTDISLKADIFHAHS